MSYIRINSKPLDPYYNNVVFQSSFEYGSNGETPKGIDERTLGKVYDESKYILQSTGKSMPYFYPSKGTGAYITSAEKAVGENSLNLDGLTILSIDNSASGFANNFDFSTGDFTVEFWYKWSGSTSNIVWSPICGTRDNLGLGWHCGVKKQFSNHSIYFYNGTYSGPAEYWPGQYISGTTSAEGSKLVTGRWNHVAFCRNNEFFMAFFNGVLQQSGNDTTSYGVSYSDTRIGSLYIGGLPAFNNFLYSGFVDNIRITSGVARYTSNFNPPTEPLLNTYYAVGDGQNPKWENTNKKSKNAMEITNLIFNSGNDINRKITIK